MEWNEDQLSFYQHLVEVLIWAIELGSIDISFEVSSLSIYLAFPRTGNLVKALHVFKYLETHNANDLDLGPSYQHITSDKNIQSNAQARKNSYVDAGE